MIEWNPRSLWKLHFTYKDTEAQGIEVIWSKLWGKLKAVLRLERKIGLLYLWVPMQEYYEVLYK